MSPALGLTHVSPFPPCARLLFRRRLLDQLLEATSLCVNPTSKGLRSIYILYHLRTAYPLLSSERQAELVEQLRQNAPRLQPGLSIPAIGLPWMVSLSPLALPSSLMPHMRQAPKVGSIRVTIIRVTIPQCS